MCITSLTFYFIDTSYSNIIADANDVYNIFHALQQKGSTYFRIMKNGVATQIQTPHMLNLGLQWENNRDIEAVSFTVEWIETPFSWNEWTNDSNIKINLRDICKQHLCFIDARSYEEWTNKNCSGRHVLAFNGVTCYGENATPILSAYGMLQDIITFDPTKPTFKELLKQMIDDGRFHQYLIEATL